MPKIPFFSESFRKSREARNEIRRLEAREAERAEQGQSPKKKNLAELKRQQGISRREFLKQFTAGTATATTVGLGGLLAKNEYDQATATEAEKIEAQASYENLSVMSDKELNDFIYSALEVLARDSKFYKQGLEAAKTKDYKFRHYDSKNSFDKEVYSALNGFDAATNKADNEVIFDLNIAHQLHQEGSRTGSFNRDFMGMLSDELVHIIFEDITSANAADEITEGALKEFYTLANGTADLSHETEFEKFIKSDIKEEFTSTIISDLIFDSDSSTPLGEIVTSQKIKEKFTNAQLMNLLQEAIDNKYLNFKTIFDSSIDKLGRATVSHLNNGLNMSKTKVAQKLQGELQGALEDFFKKLGV